MFSLNFYHRLNYLVKKKSNLSVILNFFIDRIKHPFLKSKKKLYRKIHQNYLLTKRTTTDYFSINAYYWHQIINDNYKNFSYLEIGSWEGNSALFILNNFKTKKVVCVDVWEDSNFSEIQLNNFNNFKNNMNEFKNRFSSFQGTSDNFFSKNKEKFDLIYIDGAHEAMQVYKDINNAWDALSVNGIIICDDYFYHDPKNMIENVPAVSINNFISENKNKYKIICVNNTQIFIKKILD